MFTVNQQKGSAGGAVCFIFVGVNGCKKLQMTLTDSGKHTFVGLIFFLLLHLKRKVQRVEDGRHAESQVEVVNPSYRYLYPTRAITSNT